MTKSDRFFKTAALVFSAVALLFVSQSCMDGLKADDIMETSESSYWFPNSIVTVRTSPSGKTYFQLDEETTLEPAGWKNPYKSTTRALLHFTEIGESEDCTVKVRVNRIDSVLTKPAVAVRNFDPRKDADPVEVVKDWMTVCEDGFLTIHFATLWGNEGIKHKISLTADPSDPYTLYFVHDSNGDLGTGWNEGLAAFSLGTVVPDTKGKVVNLSLVWESFAGTEKMAFRYRTRKD